MTKLNKQLKIEKEELIKKNELMVSVVIQIYRSSKIVI